MIRNTLKDKAKQIEENNSFEFKQVLRNQLAPKENFQPIVPLSNLGHNMDIQSNLSHMSTYNNYGNVVQEVDKDSSENED